jgi:hypothetical protein
MNTQPVAGNCEVAGPELCRMIALAQARHQGATESELDDLRAKLEAGPPLRPGARHAIGVGDRTFRVNLPPLKQ